MAAGQFEMLTGRRKWRTARVALSAALLVAGLVTGRTAAAAQAVPQRHATWLPSESLGTNRNWYSPPPGTSATPADAAAYGTNFSTGIKRASRETSIVNLGDSFVSGEGGRNYVAGSNGRYQSVVNGLNGVELSAETTWNGCHRSANVAIWQLTGFDHLYNFACSGAETDEVFSANDEYRNELPQSYYLARAAATTNVKAIVIGLGANDLGFGNIVKTCALNWLRFGPGCRGDVENRWMNSTDESPGQRSLASTSKRLEAVGRGVVATMRLLGYADTDYQIIFETYSSITASPAHNASLLNIFRPGDSGCTFKEADAAYFNVRGAPLIGDTAVQAVKRLLASGYSNMRVAYMRDAVLGRERCRYRSEMSRTGVQGTPTISPEWRIGDPAFALIQESMHPNQVGNALLGSCLNRIVATPISVGRHFGCRAGTALWMPTLPSPGTYP
jgi:GDSL-like Lipase/Acylhydrolase